MNKHQKPSNDILADERITAAGETDHSVVESVVPLAPAAAGLPADLKVGKIILKGVVTLAADKEGIEQAVRSCVGVSDVDNQIHVSTEKDSS